MIKIIANLNKVQGFPKSKMCYLVIYSSKMKNDPHFDTQLHFQVLLTYIESLKTISVDSMDPCGKNETLFLDFEACMWSPEPILQNWSNTLAKNTNFAIPQYI